MNISTAQRILGLSPNSSREEIHHAYFSNICYLLPTDDDKPSDEYLRFQEAYNVIRDSLPPVIEKPSVASLPKIIVGTASKKGKGKIIVPTKYVRKTKAHHWYHVSSPGILAVMSPTAASSSRVDMQVDDVTDQMSKMKVSNVSHGEEIYTAVSRMQIDDSDLLKIPTDAWTVVKLKEYLKSNGVYFKSTLKKTDLVDLAWKHYQSRKI